MENLSSAYTLKFEPLSQKYVICKKESDDLYSEDVLIQENQQPVVQPSPPPQVNPPQPNVTPSPTPVNQPQLPHNDVVCLVAELYNNTRILDMLYQQMRNISREDANTIETLMQENALTQTPLLNIYYSLSGQSVRPRQNLTVPSLGNNFCSGLVVISDYLTGMLARNLTLQRSINVTEIDRQLALINISFSTQKNTINDLLKNC